MSIKKSIQNTFHNIVDFFTSSFLSPLGKAIRESGGPILINAARAAVAAAALTKDSNEKKAQNAFHAVVQVLVASGKPVFENTIKGAIEAAYAEFKLKN